MIPDFPLISVVIPFYNRDRYLAEAIESVLNQTYPTIELIVVDDGSIDQSAEVAQRYPLIYHYQPNQGISAARNAGIALATGQFFAFLDSDDIWVLDKLSRQMLAFKSEPNLEAVFGYAQQFYSPEVDGSFRRRVKCPEEPIAAHLSTSILIRREALLRIGLFDVNLKVGTDFSWFISATEQKLRYKTLPEVLYRRRLHESNNGSTQLQYKKHRLYLLKEKLDRQRVSK